MGSRDLYQNLLFPDDDGNTVEVMKNRVSKIYVKEAPYNTFTWTEDDIFAIREGLIHEHINGSISTGRSLNQRLYCYQWFLSKKEGPFTFVTCAKAVGYDSVEILDGYVPMFSKWNLFLAFKTMMGELSPFERGIQMAKDWIESQKRRPWSYLTLCQNVSLNPDLLRSDTDYRQSKLLSAFGYLALQDKVEEDEGTEH